MEGATFHGIPTDFIISSRHWILVITFCFRSPVDTSREHSSTLWYSMCTKTSFRYKRIMWNKKKPSSRENKIQDGFLLFVRSPCIGYFVLRNWIRANPGQNGSYTMWKIHHSNNLFHSTKHRNLCFSYPGKYLLHLNRPHFLKPSCQDILARRSTQRFHNS